MGALALGIVADDLSGAAECASHALVRVPRSNVQLASLSTRPAATAPGTVGTVVTVDTDSRGLDAEHAARAVRAAAPLVADARVVVKKVDSLLRGNVAAEVAALAEHLHRVPVVAVANPALDRVVRDGVLHVGGTPLHDTDLWVVERGPAPRRVADALHPLRVVLVSHATVLSGVEAVAVALVDAYRTGLVAVCDALTEADLDVVHAAAVSASAAHGSGTLLVGSGALADAAVRALPDVRDSSPLGRPPEGHQRQTPAAGDTAYALRTGHCSSLLVVLGTRAPGVPAQIAQLEPLASETLLLAPDTVLDDPTGLQERLAALAAAGVVLVALDTAAPVDARRSRALTEALAAAVAPLLDRYDATFLSGGESARAVLDRLDVHSLDVIGEVETGTVVSRRPGGRLVVTRPGSYGDPASLVRVAEHVLGHCSPTARSTAPTHTAPTHTAPTHTATRATAGANTEENS